MYQTHSATTMPLRVPNRTPLNFSMHPGAGGGELARDNRYASRGLFGLRPLEKNAQRDSAELRYCHGCNLKDAVMAALEVLESMMEN